MLSISTEMIKEIADQLDCGMKCFYHFKTGELIFYPDEMKWSGDIDEEIWGEDMEKVEENYGDYLAFTAMESHESFRVMEDFIEQIPDKKYNENLKMLFTEENRFSKLNIYCLIIPTRASNGLLTRICDTENMWRNR
jgi:hypothetical protein